ncbi:MAG: DUF4159 domain-containing protein [Candidatus Latescibacteria bacterium]|nr:DUF4159 domain-containing protein [Candidatus Latescibacterota bacterium]
MDKTQSHIQSKHRSTLTANPNESGYIEAGKLLVLCGLMLVLFHSLFALFFTFDNGNKLYHKPVAPKITVERHASMKPLTRWNPEEKVPQEINIDTCFFKALPLIAVNNPLSHPHISQIGSVTYYPPSIRVSDSFTASVVQYQNQDSGICRVPDKRTSLRAELIRPEDLDYGRYKSFIRKDKSDRQHIQGFIHIPTVWGMQLKPPDSLKRSVIDITMAMNRYTNICAESDPHLFLDSHKLLDTPFIFITTDQTFELNEIERKNLRDYLKNGGFVVLDNGNPTHPNGPGEVSLRQMLHDSLGAHARFEPIPVNHPVYHCFFDFDDGPPNGSETYAFIPPQVNMGYSGETRTFWLPKPVYYLEGIWMNGHLSAIYSDKGFFERWKTNPRFSLENNTPRLKMCVNFVMYALLREDSITQKISDRYY